LFSALTAFIQEKGFYFSELQSFGPEFSRFIAINITRTGGSIHKQ
jgi:hypothetical protein